MITKQDLLDWLKQIDKNLKKKMTIIAVGGTAMTLLNLKESTKDVDFCVETNNYNKFKELSKSNIFIVDIFQEGYIFTLQLPEDYKKKSSKHKQKFKYLDLRVLMLEDIIITKTARLNTRDIEDIKILSETGKINLNRLKERFKEVYTTFAGNEKDFKYHFNLVLKMFFENK
jgi:hypothetical protein